MRKIFPIIPLQFVNVIGFSILIPVLPEIVSAYYGVNNFTSGLVYGALLSSYAFCQFLAAPLLGSLSDKYGRRPLLILSQAGTFASWLIMIAAYFLPDISVIKSVPLVIVLFFASRIIDGLTGGNISVAQAWVSDVTTKEEKNQAFGLLGAVFGIGFLIGPLLGGLSASTRFGYLGTALLAASISLITLVLLYFKLPESLSLKNRNPKALEGGFQNLNVFSKFKLFKDKPAVENLLWLRVVYTIVFAAFTTTLTLFLQNSFGLHALGIGMVLGVIGFFAIINQAVLVQRIGKHLGNEKAFYLGIVFFVISLLLLPLTFILYKSGYVILSFVVFFIDSYLLNLGASLSFTLFKSILVTNVDDKNQGTATGIDESLIAFGNSISPISAGVIFGFTGNWTFALLAVLLGVPAILIYLRFHHEQAK